MLLQVRIARDGKRRGAIAVLVAVLMTVLLGILAIAIDGGLLLDNKRRVQAVADAAAVAAAQKLYLNFPALIAPGATSKDPGGEGATAALNTAARNGLPDDGITSNVQVNIPPATGPFVGRIGYAEVIVTYYQPRYFSSIWGTTVLPVRARAVGRGRWEGSGTGIYVLDPHQQDALDATGTGSVTVTGGAWVIDDSDNASAARLSGGGGLTAPDFQITGGMTGTPNGVVNTNVPPTPDPLAYLPVPAQPPAGSMDVTNLMNGNKQYTLSPGTFRNLPVFNVGDVVIFKQASAGNGGIYYIDGGGLKSTGASLTMDPTTSGGIMIYNKPQSQADSQKINITGNDSGKVALGPLTDGPYAGILFFQDRTSSVPLNISGNGDFNLQGTFYTANGQLQITGNGNTTIGSQYVSRTLTLSGNGNINIDYHNTVVGRLREIGLVE